MRRILSAISIILFPALALAQLGVPTGTSFTYQGQLRRSGAAYSGTCNFQFSLWNFPTQGFNQGPHLSLNDVTVVNGLFTVSLDFGDQFNGESRWLSTSVQCSGDPGFTALDPRQPITATPYALSLRPGATIVDFDTSASRPPVLTAQSFSASGGSSGLSGIASGFSAAGVRGSCSGQEGSGVRGTASHSTGKGVYGTATGVNAAGVFGENSSGAGIWGKSTGAGSAVYGENTSTGLAGRFSGPVDIAGRLTVSISSNAIAIAGTGFTGVAGFSGSSGGTGVRGEALLADSAGVFGLNRDSAAIWGRSTGAGSAVYGENTSTGFAGRFVGPVSVQGTLTKSAGTFQIDHPLDPANKFLSHSFVESPDMMNIYNGNVTTDASGNATVTLPDYFEALNRDYRYQLTVMGQFAQAIISREMAGNSFEIQTDKPGVKVSWEVTGIRQDAYARANPIVVEKFKSAEEQGKYLYPAAFGAGEEKRIGHLQGPLPARGAQDPSGAGPDDPASK